jgi:hypothetical protein
VQAQETTAISVIRTIHTVQVQYYWQFGTYATSLTEVGPPARGVASSAAADLISSDAASGLKSGYRLSLASDQGGYVINARPILFGSTGSHTLYSDQTMVIRQNDGPEAATAASPEIR